MRTSFYHTKGTKFLTEGNNSMYVECLNQNTENTPPTSTENSPLKDFINHDENATGIKILAVEQQVEFVASKDSDNGTEHNSDVGTVALAENGSDNMNKTFEVDTSYATSSLIRPLSPCYAERFKNDKCRPIEILNCPECPKKFKYNRQLTKHLLKHRQKRTISTCSRRSEYRCDECDAILSSKLIWRKHMLNHAEMFYCDICHESFVLQQDLDWHYAICDGQNRGKMEAENVITRRKTRSQSGYYAKRLIDDGSLSCVSGVSNTTSIADSIYTVRQDFVKRYVRERIRLSQLPPEDDNFDDTSSVVSGFTNITSVSRRSVKSRNKSGTGLQSMSFHCMLCPCFYNDMTEIMQHEIDVHKIQPRYSCLECFFYFTRREYLEIHERVHRQNLRCHMCLKEFYTKSEHREHIRKHIQKSYKCYVCPLRFVSQHHLRRHRIDANHPSFIKRYPRTKSLILKRKYYGKKSSFSELYPPIEYKSFQCIDLIQPPSTQIISVNQGKVPFKMRLYNGIYEKPPPREQEILIHGSTVEELINYLRMNPEYNKYPINIIHDQSDEILEEEQIIEQTPNKSDNSEHNKNDNFVHELFSVDSIDYNSDDGEDVQGNIEISPNKLTYLNPMPTYTDLFNNSSNKTNCNSSNGI